MLIDNGDKLLHIFRIKGIILRIILHLPLPCRVHFSKSIQCILNKEIKHILLILKMLIKTCGRNAHFRRNPVKRCLLISVCKELFPHTLYDLRICLCLISWQSGSSLSK